MCQRPEVRQHPLLIGRDPGEQFEGAAAWKTAMPPPFRVLAPMRAARANSSV